MRAIFLFVITLCLSACTAARVLTHVPNLDPVDAPVGQYIIDQDHKSLLFKVDHLGFSTFVGQFNRFDGVLDFNPQAPEQSRLSVRIDTASIDSNSDVLDQLLAAANMFDVANHPQATFVSQEIARTGPATGQIVGILTIKGRAHPVTLDVTFNGGGANPLEPVHSLGFSARTVIDRSRWGLGAWVPAVGQEVELVIEIEFEQPRP